MADKDRFSIVFEKFTEVCKQDGMSPDTANYTHVITEDELNEIAELQSLSLAISKPVFQYRTTY